MDELIAKHAPGLDGALVGRGVFQNAALARSPAERVVGFLRIKISARSFKAVSSNSRTMAKLSVRSFISVSNGWIAS